jgi:Tfp pilus assembly protein PilO
MSLAGSNFVQLLKRWPYCCGCVVVMLVSTGAAVWFHDRNGDLRTVHEQRTTEGEAMVALLVGGSTQRLELEAVKEAAKRIDDNLVIEANLAENLWYFYKIEEQTKAHLPELHQLTSPASDKSPLYRRIPYSLRLNGTYDQVASFLQALETGPRLARIVTFNFSRAGVVGSGVALDLTVELLGKR